MDSRTVLLLDADVAGRSVTERFLREHGYRVITADDATSGLEAFRSGIVDLVITDVMLPGRSSFALLEQLKRAKPHVRVIMLSGMEGAAHRALAELLGADEYLSRPVSMNRLNEVVRRLCPLRSPKPESATHEAVNQTVVSNAR